MADISKEQIAELIAVLHEHHKWHCQEDVYLNFEEFGKMSVAECYVHSNLEERTSAILSAIAWNMKEKGNKE